MRPRIGILNNLRAGRGARCVPRILDLLRRYPDVAHVETDGPRSPDALFELARREIDLLVINGGDGTLQCALTEILGNPELDAIRHVAPLRGGRTNMTARDIGADRDPVRGVARLLEAARDGRLDEHRVERPVLCCESTLRTARQYGLFFGGGLIQRAITLHHRLFPEDRARGVLGPGIVMASMLGRVAARSRQGVLTPDKVQFSLAGAESVDGSYLLLMASTLERLFLGLDPFWGRGRGEVRFTSIASDAHRLNLGSLGLLRGRTRDFHTAENGYTSENVDDVRLRFDCGFTVDGEIFGAEPDENLHLSSDRRIRFLRA